MKLELIFESRYRYDTTLDPVVVDGGRPVQLLGEGSGIVTGAEVAGTVEFINAPSIRDDGALTPNVRGLIKIAGGGRVRYDTQGISLEVDPGRPDIRRFVCSVRFFTKVERLAWMNRAVGAEEGIIDLGTGQLASRVYRMVHTLESTEP